MAGRDSPTGVPRACSVTEPLILVRPQAKKAVSRMQAMKSLLSSAAREGEMTGWWAPRGPRAGAKVGVKPAPARVSKGGRTGSVAQGAAKRPFL